MNEVDWGRYNLPAIWSLISDVDVCTGADRVLAWDGLASTVREQHKRLLAAADRLAEVWPPAENDSARFFLQQVNGLADSMQETLQKAENTRAGLQGVIGAFSTAQGTVRELAAGRQAVSNDWMPRFVDHAEDKYDEHAQAAMRQAEAAIQDHSSQIEAPSLFRMDPLQDDAGHHLTLEDGGSANGSSTGDRRTAGLSARPRPVAVQMDENSMIPPSHHDGGIAAGDNGSGRAAGPILSGVSTGLPPSGDGTASSADPAGSMRTPGSGAEPGGQAVLPIGGGGGFGSIGAAPGRSAAGGAIGPVPIRRGLPSGVVIGAESDQGALAGKDVVGPMPLGAGAQGRGRTDATKTISGRPEQRWETLEGVVPVIRPDTAPARHDPGPGVIGFNK